MSTYVNLNNNKCLIFNIFVFFAAIYLLTSSGINMEEFDVGLHRLEVSRSIVERLDFNVPAGTGITGADGRDYSWFGIGSVLVSLPFYIFGKVAGVTPVHVVNLMNQLFGAAIVVLVFLFCNCLGYSRRSSIYVSIIYGLGTMAWYYAKDPGDHVLETFFVLLSFLGMYRFIISEKIRYIFISGASFGIAFLTRGNSIIMMLPLLLMFGANYIKKYDVPKTPGFMSRGASLFFIAMIPFVGIFLWYNNYRFGSIFESGYTLIASRLGIDFFSGTPLITGLVGLLVSPGKGFFYYSPITILFFFSIRSFWRKHAIIAVGFAGTIVLYILFYAKNIYWHGDWAWGPRYLFVLTPFFVIPIAEIFDGQIWIRNKLVRTVTCLLFMLGILVQILAVSVNTYSYFVFLKTKKQIPFTIVKGVGVQEVKEPVPETYYNWKLSPILVHAQMAYAIVSKMKDYKYTAVSVNSAHTEKMIDNNLLDFWWIYKYYFDGSRIGLFVTPIFVIYIIVVGIRLRKLSSQ